MDIIIILSLVFVYTLALGGLLIIAKRFKQEVDTTIEEQEQSKYKIRYNNIVTNCKSIKFVNTLDDVYVLEYKYIVKEEDGFNMYQWNSGWELVENVDIYENGQFLDVQVKD